MDRPVQAQRHFEKGLNCAQAILTVYGPEYGLDETLARKLGSPLVGGLGNMGLVCGAVHGACLVLGLRYGHTRPGDAGEQRTVQAVQEFRRRFEAARGHIICRGLVKCDIRSEEKLAQAAKAGAFKDCPQHVRTAAQILESMLAEDGAVRQPAKPV